MYVTRAFLKINHFKYSLKKSVSSISSENRCRVPPKIWNGNVNVTGLTPDSVVIYSCEKGHQLKGNSMLFCVSKSQQSHPSSVMSFHYDWHQEKPICEGMIRKHINFITFIILYLFSRYISKFLNISVAGRQSSIKEI